MEYVLAVVALLIIMSFYMYSQRTEMFKLRKHKPNAFENQAFIEARAAQEAADKARAAANVASIRAHRRAIAMREQCRIAARKSHATIDQAREMCK